MKTLTLATLLVALAAGATARAAAQTADNPLSDAKRAYEAAAYEDALRLLEPLDSPDARQYVALCLMALGRTDEAARAVEAMVTAEPLFALLSAAETSKGTAESPENSSALIRLIPENWG